MKKKRILFVFCILAMILVNIYIVLMVKPDTDALTTNINIEFSADRDFCAQFFYSSDTSFDENRSREFEYTAKGGSSTVTVEIPARTQYLRMDFGEQSNVVSLSKVYLSEADKQIDFSYILRQQIAMSNAIEHMEYSDSKLRVNTQDGDSFIVLNTNSDIIFDFCYGNSLRTYRFLAIVLCVITDIVGVICLRHFAGFIQIPEIIVQNREMIWEMTKNDFQAKFAGSFFGIFWAFIQPIIITLLYWFVFQVGLRAGDAADYPFVLFLMSGLVPWFYFSEALSGGSSVLVEYNYLVKKVVFDVRILPIIKIFSALFVHVFFVVVIFVISWVYGYGPSLYTLQIFYYVICSIALISGVCYLVSAVTVFFRDMTQIVNIILTIGVWITPIMWRPDGLNKYLKILFMANPIYYLVDGYRDILIYHEWFWNKPIWTVYFWLICMVLYCAGMRFFNKSQAHFADML